MVNLSESKINQLLETAAKISEFSHDPYTKVGALLVDTEGTILATGYNGFIRQADNNLASKLTRDEKNEIIQHAETNLLSHCCRNGISTRDRILFCTHSPCIKCSRQLFQAGITNVVFSRAFRDLNKQITDLPDLGIKLISTNNYNIMELYAIR